MKNKGFTLIELLAVIIILGILMLVAIPSVTSYINNSRKEAYIDAAKEYIKGATNLVNSGALDIYDTGVTYYIPSTCVSLETGGTSPYGGKFNPAYIIVTYNNDSYNYYWMSRDDNGIGIRKPINSNKLKSDLIESTIKESEISAVYAVDGRSTIIEFSSDCNDALPDKPATGYIPGEESSGGGNISYPDGKDKNNIAIGDIITIGTEQFYVYKVEANSIYLLARYNLTVGYLIRFSNGVTTTIREHTPSADPTYGKQNSLNVGTSGRYAVTEDNYGTIVFSTSSYWDTGSGLKPNYSGSYSNPNYPFVYDSNSLLYSYVNNYARSLGVSVKEARLLDIREAYALGCDSSTFTCGGAPAFIGETSFWMGNAESRNYLWGIVRGGSIGCVTGGGQPGYVNDGGFGLRPVIVIDKQ